MSTIYVNAQSNTGTVTASFPQAGAVPSVTPALMSLQVSQAGPTQGPNAKVTIWDGPVGSGTVIFATWLQGSGTGSVGNVQDISLPRDTKGNQCIQALPGNQMNVQVTGTGANQVSVNCRFQDGLPGD